MLTATAVSSVDPLGDLAGRVSLNRALRALHLRAAAELFPVDRAAAREHWRRVVALKRREGRA